LARIRATLRAALNAAIREGLISANPARLVELPSAVRPHPVVWTVPREAAWRESGVRPAVAVWTAEQMARFLAVICREPLYPCYHLMAVSGLRRGEAAGLRWCDIDFAGATLTVSRQLQEPAAGWWCCRPRASPAIASWPSIPGPCKSLPPTAADSYLRRVTGTSSPVQADVLTRPGT
jgi:integrase